MNSILDNLIKTAQVWQAGQFTSRNTHAISSGWQQLDKHLPGGGWPQSALTELLCDTAGIGELKLLLPAIKTVTDEGRYAFWVDPPFTPCATALAQQGIDLSRLVIIHSNTTKDGLWSLEQILQNQSCGIAIAWPGKVSTGHIRRLQLAAERAQSAAFLFRSVTQSKEHSSAALRLVLTPVNSSLGVSIIKRRGGWAVKQQLIDVGQRALNQSGGLFTHQPIKQPHSALNAPANQTHAAPSSSHSDTLIEGPWPHRA